MDNTALSDLDLLKLLREEDEEAFAELYNRYSKGVYSIAFKYTRSQESSKDIVQEVFLKLWSNKANLAEVRNFKPFLFVSARNLIISSLRIKVFHSSIDGEEDLTETEALLPDHQLSYKQSLALLHNAIEQLPAQQKKAYKLSRDEGKKYEEIAVEMGLSVSTVKIHVSKALSFIRTYLTNNSVHPVLLMLILLGKK